MAAAASYNLALVNTVMNNNYAQNGGGLYVSGCNDLVAYNVSMKNNSATVSGGGIFQVCSSLPHSPKHFHASLEPCWPCTHIST